MKKRARERPSSCWRMARLALMRITIHEKTREYVALDKPSRTLAATSGETGDVIQSVPALMRRCVSADESALPSMRRNDAISLTTDWSAMPASSPLPKAMLPNFMMHAHSVHTYSTATIVHTHTHATE